MQRKQLKTTTQKQTDWTHHPHYDSRRQKGSLFYMSEVGVVEVPLEFPDPLPKDMGMLEEGDE